MPYYSLGEVLNVSNVAAGQVSTQSTVFNKVNQFLVENTRGMRAYIQTTQACEVYYYTNDGTVDDWGNLLGLVSGSTSGLYASIAVNPVVLGKSVKFAVKNTSASLANFILRVSLLADY